MNKRTALLLFLLLFVGISLGVYWLGWGYHIVPLREGLYLGTSFFATVAGIFAFRTFGAKNERALTFLCLTAGMGYLFLGEVLFNYYQYILGINPYPSVADVFYLFAYPFLLIGLINEIKIAQINWHKIHKPILFLFGLVAAMFALLTIYFGIYHAYDPVETFFSNVIAMSYGVGDLLLIIASILLLILAWEFRGGKLSRVWFIVFASFLFMLSADILFAIYHEEYTMHVGYYKNVLDSLWMASYLLFAAALFEFGFSLQDVYQKIVRNASKLNAKSTHD